MRSVLLSLLIFWTVPALSQSQIELTDHHSEREVIMKTQSGDLYGTLTIPLENKLGVVALIIPGSGPTDRDGNSAMIQGKNNSLKMLADSLAVRGISTLRIDKRGIAKSKDARLSEADMRFEDMVEDAVSWMRFLKADSRFKKIAVVGHSEGSLVGMLAAEISDANAYVSIAGVGQPADAIIRGQLAKQLTPELLDTASLYINSLKKGEEVEKVNPLFQALFRPSVQPYLISWFKYNPAVEIKSLKCKVLLVQGTKDIQVDEKEADILSAAFPSAKVLKIEGMNHVLKQIDNDKDNLKSYADPSFMLPEKLIEGLAEFLLAK